MTIDARKAHAAMMEAFDTFTQSLLENERAAMLTRQLEAGADARQAEREPQAHVARLTEKLEADAPGWKPKRCRTGTDGA